MTGSKSSSMPEVPVRVNKLLPAIFILLPLACCLPAARADAPDWLRAAAASATSLPKYPAETKEVELLHDETVTLQPGGEPRLAPASGVQDSSHVGLQ